MNKNYTKLQIIQKLTEAGLKITPQRVEILYFLVNSKQHPTADEIFNSLKSEVSGISLATVYKTLNTFYQLNIIKKIKGEDESVHFDADTDSHNHLICVRSKKIMDFNDSELENLINNYFLNKKIEGFKIKEIQLNIFGETN